MTEGLQNISTCSTYSYLRRDFGIGLRLPPSKYRAQAAPQFCPYYDPGLGKATTGRTDSQGTTPTVSSII